MLGAVGDIGPRGVFPLTGMAAQAAGRNRVALVGEAVHVIPPIGAQGLNLGLRDAACIADCVADALAIGGDIAAPAVLEAYGRMRSTDIASRIWTVDLLNRSLLSSAAPVQALRGIGLHILKNVGPLRRLAIREGPGRRSSRRASCSRSHPRRPLALTRADGLGITAALKREIAVGRCRQRNAFATCSGAPNTWCALVAGFFRALPLGIATGASAWCWRRLAPIINPKRHKRALDNLAVAFPENTDAERLAIALAHWENLGRVMVETMRIDRFLAEPSASTSSARTSSRATRTSSGLPSA